MISHNNQKKMAVINDISGFGRCSLTVMLPIISKLKIQCCPVLTSIFSNHSGYREYFFQDYTPYMREYISNWKKLGLEFQGIATGFLGSREQIEIVIEFIREFKREDTVVIVDPVMGDQGQAYATYTEEMCQEMKKLVSYADILTPNLTEACILTDTPYETNKKWKKKELVQMAEKLLAEGPDKVVITGIHQGEFLVNLVCEKGEDYHFLRIHQIGIERSGTGDIFSSIVAADAVNGVSFQKSVRKAAVFIKKCILRSIELELPDTDGVCFEEILDQLKC